MRFELTTLTLARLCSTPELRPRSVAHLIAGRSGGCKVNFHAAGAVEEGRARPGARARPGMRARPCSEASSRGLPGKVARPAQLRTPAKRVCQSSRSSSVILRNSTSGTVKAWPAGRVASAARDIVGPATSRPSAIAASIVAAASGMKGAREHGVEPDQVQRQPHLRRRLVGVGLEGRPGRGGLQVFVARDPDRAQLGRGLADLDRLHVRLVGAQPRGQLGDQRGLGRAQCAARGHRLAEFRAAELGDAADEIAQHVGQVLVHRGLEVLPGELAVASFRARGSAATSASNRPAGSPAPGP